MQNKEFTKEELAKLLVMVATEKRQTNDKEDFEILESISTKLCGMNYKAWNEWSKTQNENK